VTVNHDLKLLRKMFNWGIRKGYLERTPFQVGSESAITLEREIPRDWRFESDGDEEGLFNAANPHLRAVLIALLDTAARLGEILSLQWKDVKLERRELVVRAEKSKTRTGRVVPILGSSARNARDAAVGPSRSAVPIGRLRLWRCPWAQCQVGSDSVEMRVIVLA
jgi:integrase